MSFTPSAVNNVILISICLTCLFMHTFIGNDFIYLLDKLFHRPMTFGNKNIFVLISINLTFFNTDLLFLIGGT